VAKLRDMIPELLKLNDSDLPVESSTPSMTTRWKCSDD
jgi:hypothetical protein